ncbi:hypothetical protein M406DRAFT_347205 [Cryphonectria parasitica EP155]|uniref:Phosphatidic acid phosphatase type 2/haloperoxidase domain-containing protein n=1 Tax=Cryphonectria parasitica (strain ATCC 38755 / EP155) TaxID=660469 RepID=A0A9P4XZK0_CRYP1|nr:uncharacterized protein M406DRAFT_347205 [Cryphonectria parasitica EP155]KAF3763662.1 hypothetical protein M406DRAFT_347205 [Cryphonectria parasitica EP155]
MQDLSNYSPQAKPKLHIPHLQWPGALKIKIPERYRSGGGDSRRSRSRKPRRKHHDEPTSLTRMQTSFNPMDGVRAIQRHRWGWLDIQYPALAGFMLFSLIIAPMPILVKIAIPLVSVFVCLMPATRQFFLPSMPIWIYLLYFFCSRFIPVQYRPHIWVKVLPALENVLYGANISNILSAHTHAVLDLLAWLPYGIGHFGGPAVVSVTTFIFAAPKTTPVFARSFGWLCLAGVTLSLVFPCTPPWYEKEHGLEPAHYGMSGSPAGLARIDKLLGVDMYTTSFTTAPMPFGAFPSLHAANATLEALFMSFCFPKLRPLFIFYVGWLWWATMYLNHHYAIDLVAGSLMSTGVYTIARARYLPRQQPDKKNRWAYEFVEIGDKPRNLDEEYGLVGKADGEGYSLGLLEQREDEDEWTIGSSSSFSASSSPRTSTTSPTLLSPSTPDGEFAHVTIPMGLDGQLMWEGAERAPARESELSEVVVVR